MSSLKIGQLRPQQTQQNLVKSFFLGNWTK